MARPRKDDETPAPRHRPPTTAEAREKQLVGLAADLVEKKLRAGTATSQEITYLLKLGTVRETRERDRLEAEVKLLEARVAQMATSESSEQLYGEVLRAMTIYKGEEDVGVYLD